MKAYQAHGNQGNTNAQKSEVAATSHLNMRCVQIDKAGWVKAAQKENMKLSEWVNKTLNNAANN